MTKKIKVLTLSDHPLSPSGVGTQTRYMIEALLKTGKFEILSLGGAIKHHDYTPKSVQPWEDAWRIIPVDGYGTQEMIRSILRNEKPDILWMMTDPRFYEWLWAIENEIRPLVPIVYYHVWDNFPAPHFNKKFYESNDLVVAISKLTHDVVKKVAPDVPLKYIPHAVREDVFKPVSEDERGKLRENILGADKDRFVAFWNNRNARRKQSGTLIWWWKEWLDKRDLHQKAQLIMHTEPKDPHGQDLGHIVRQLGLDSDRQVLFSTQKVPLEQMGNFYRIADVTINISDAEGFGLATLESLSCGTPIIANMTGGLQEQVLGPEGENGVAIFPASKAIIGSQQVPYIYEDRISKEAFFAALDKMYFIDEKARRELGEQGHRHVRNNYSFEEFEEQWVNTMLKVHEEEGSWETRKGHNGIVFKEIA
jgi:glycosyltransferase involved in cell wall biosynthesis